VQQYLLIEAYAVRASMLDARRSKDHTGLFTELSLLVESGNFSMKMHAV
jgi:hypothetical protein